MFCLSILAQGYNIMKHLAYDLSILAWGKEHLGQYLASFFNMWHTILLILLFDPFDIP
jgi:hypothetical protein